MHKQAEIYLNHAPNHEKYALCNRIRNQLNDVYEYAVEGYKRYHKKTTLQNLDIAHEKVRMSFRLFFEKGYFHYMNKKQQSTNAEALQRSSAMTKHIDDVGWYIGKWLNQNS